MATSNNHSLDVKPKPYHKPKGRKFWINNIEAWSQRGLAQAEYCRQNNISKTAFYGWKCKLKAEEHEIPEHHFAPVEVVPTIENKSDTRNRELNTDILEITCPNGYKVSLPIQADHSNVLDWLESLSSLR